MTGARPTLRCGLAWKRVAGAGGSVDACAGVLHTPYSAPVSELRGLNRRSIMWHIIKMITPIGKLYTLIELEIS